MDDEVTGLFEFLTHSTEASMAHYRGRAAHLRAMADDAPLVSIRDKLSEIAVQFEQLADRITISRRR
jgi:hypothetical protein